MKLKCKLRVSSYTKAEFPSQTARSEYLSSKVMLGKTAKSYIDSVMPYIFPDYEELVT